VGQPREYRAVVVEDHEFSDRVLDQARAGDTQIVVGDDVLLQLGEVGGGQGDGDLGSDSELTCHRLTIGRCRRPPEPRLLCERDDRLGGATSGAVGEEAHGRLDLGREKAVGPGAGHRLPQRGDDRDMSG
jgi:hypothetical protein